MHDIIQMDNWLILRLPYPLAGTVLLKEEKKINNAVCKEKLDSFSSGYKAINISSE